MLTTLEPIPLPPVPYHYDPSDHAVRVSGEPQQLYLAMEHMKTRAPRYIREPGSPRGAKLTVAAVCLGLYVLRYVVYTIGLGHELPRVVGNLWGAFSPLLFLAALGFGIWGLMSKPPASRRVVMDPAVNENVDVSAMAGQLLRGLAPGVYDLTGRLFRGQKAASGRGASNRAIGLMVRAPAGWELSIEHTDNVEYSRRIEGRQYIETSRTSNDLEYWLSYAQMPADAAARVASMSPAMMPAYPDASITGFEVRNNALHLRVHTVHAPPYAAIAAYANALARVAGLPGPVFAA